MAAPLQGQGSQSAQKWRVAEVFRRYAHPYRASHVLAPQQARVLAAIASCRTAQLGGHLEYCTECGYTHPVYNSCRDRHCPSCQAYAQRDWLALREQRVLPVRHFHVVFTLPAQLRPLALSDPRTVYDIVFAAASATLMRLGRDRLGVELGVTMVLHTWTRELLLHPHVHCIVTGGGLTPSGSWTASQPAFLFPIGAMRKLFRGIVRSRLQRAYEDGRLRLPADIPDATSFRALLRSSYRKSWVVYCKAPFAGAKHVFGYLGRYTHRVGISDQRIVEVTDETVTFRTRGSAVVTLSTEAFIGRFLLHVLPGRFHKTRHYGLYSGSAVHGKLAVARALLQSVSNEPGEEPADEVTPRDSEAAPGGSEAASREPRRCPVCGTALVVLPLSMAVHLGMSLLWPVGRDPPDTS